jgi:hypothetical protein
VFTAAEVEQMSPVERRSIFDASLVTELHKVPPDFLTRVNGRVEKVIADTESTDDA